VIGAGVSGLTAAYLLQRRYDVHLFEADDRLGGHAHTHDVVTADAGAVPVDSGFIVHNARTYPHLLRLFAELGVETQPADMSMSVRCEGCGLEYAGARGAGGLFAQGRSAYNPAFLRMLVEVKRFHRHARRVMELGSDDLTLRDFLAVGGYSRYFVAHFMVPVVSAVWSAAPGVALRYPARYLFTFLANHGMLTVFGSPPWRSVVGGSRTYVERAVKHLTAVHVATPVRSVTRGDGAVRVRDDADQVHAFDRVVIATHADTALALLADPTDAERRALGAFPYSSNDAVLHTDPRLLPTAPRARASWNYLLPACDADTDRVLVSYDMNRLQSLPTATPHVVTLNATERIAPDLVVARVRYEHPIYTPESVAAQRLLPDLNDGRTAFAGAYHGWGFHEDGCRSGAAAAASLGVAW
ncbi:MAG: FAD-dependent oxidoreductase, partial [Frankiaceae bacterium]|nr:FAD-dependent oxidoreductase [Frankiaceae bacterium]MBV9369924.1 FAD-dependent oxidoreductase [Frankiales bacterium]